MTRLKDEPCVAAGAADAGLVLARLDLDMSFLPGSGLFVKTGDGPASPYITT
jgi:hypothetical protein